MQIELTRKFIMQVENLKDRSVKKKLLSVIDAVSAAENMINFPNLKKLVSFKNYYRIRLGSYRIGISIIDQKVIFSAFDHRSNIYNYFPFKK